METVCNWLLLSNRLEWMHLFLAAAFYMHGILHCLHAEFCIAPHNIKRRKWSFISASFMAGMSFSSWLCCLASCVTFSVTVREYELGLGRRACQLLQPCGDAKCPQSVEMLCEGAVPTIVYH
jgi:hypothetical protein